MLHTKIIDVSKEKIETKNAEEFIASSNYGASLVFYGTVRDINDNQKVKGITYDVHEELVIKSFNEIYDEADKKLKIYNASIIEAKANAKKIISDSRKKLNEDLSIKKKQIESEIQKEIENAEKEIQRFKINSTPKMISISEEIVSNVIKDIFGEDLNKSSIKATVTEINKGYKN